MKRKKFNKYLEKKWPKIPEGKKIRIQNSFILEETKSLMYLMLSILYLIIGVLMVLPLIFVILAKGYGVWLALWMFAIVGIIYIICVFILMYQDFKNKEKSRNIILKFVRKYGR